MYCINLALIVSIAIGIALCAPSPQKLRIQPELDSLDVPKYLQNERLVRLQFKCLIFDGPCDIVGRWAKPRAKGLLLGTCEMCTETQQGWITTWFDILTEKFPDMYRAAVAKYIQNEGIAIDQEEQQKIQEAFREDDVQSFFENVKDIDKVPIEKLKATSSSKGNEILTKATMAPADNGKLTNVTMTSPASTTTTTTPENNEMETTTTYSVEDNTEMETKS